MSAHANIKCSVFAATVLALLCGRSGYAQLTLNAMGPASGSGASQTFTFSGSSPSGYGYITFIQMMFSWENDGFGACYAYYYQPGNAVYLLNNAQNQALGGYAPGSSNTISNGQCAINVASTTVSHSGNTLTVNFAVSFSSSFIGLQKAFGDLDDQAGNTTGMVQLGTWTPYTASTALPTGLTVSPSSGSGTSQTFSFHVSDANGYGFIPQLWALFQTGSNPACEVYYEQAANQLYLLNTAGTSWTNGYLGNVTTLSNSQCSIDLLHATTAGTGGNDLYLNLPITFSAGFSGPQGIYQRVYDHLDQSVGWTQTGAWTVPSITALTLNAMSPSSGIGASQTFTLSGSSPNGFGYITFVQMMINWEDDGAGACYAYYSQSGNAVYLQSDNGGQSLGGYAPGSSNNISNGQCTINLASTTVSGYSDTLTVNFAVTFSSSFIGPQKVFCDVSDQAGNTSGMVQSGTWTPYPASSTQPPSGLSVSPASGSLLSQIFSFHANDANGYRYIPQLWALFQTGTGPACSFYYEQAANQLYLFNNAGVPGATSGYLGSATTLSNSQCSIDLAHATTTGTGGNDLYLNLPITFSIGFSGPQGIYELAYDHLGQSVGWIHQEGWTWNVPAPASQTITFGPLSNVTYGVSPFTISATASSGLPVSFAASPSTVCVVAGSTVTVEGAGACTITASQAGSINYAAAPNVVQGFTVAHASQTITFNPLSGVTLGVAPFAISATASSGLTVSLTQTTNSDGVCSVSGTTVTIEAGGTCTIIASQPGSSGYSGAPSVSQSFTVSGFSVTSIPTQYVVAGTGDPSPTTATVTATGGFNQMVSLTAPNPPSGISVSFSPNSVAPGASTQVSFQAAAATAPGTYQVTLQATAGSIQVTQSVNVYVPNFTPVAAEFLTPLDDGTVYAFFTFYFTGPDADLFSSEITQASYTSPNGQPSGYESGGWQYGSVPAPVRFPSFSLPSNGFGVYNFTMVFDACDPAGCPDQSPFAMSVSYPMPSLSLISPSHSPAGTSSDATITGVDLGARDEGSDAYPGVASINVSGSGGLVGSLNAPEPFQEGQPTGTQVSATIDATNAAPGNYQVSLTVFGYTTNSLSFTVDDLSPQINAVTDTNYQTLDALPQGAQTYVILFGSGFGSAGSVSICAFGASPCASSDVSAQVSYWGPGQINLLVTTAASSQGTYDIQVTSGGASGNGFFQASGGGVGAQSNRAQVGVATTTLTLSRVSLTQVQATATPQGGTFTESIAQTTATGTVAQLGSTVNVATGGSEVLTFSLISPANPTGNGAPSPGGMAQVTVSYQPASGTPLSRQFNVPTYGMSCYYTALQSDRGTAPNACQSTTIFGITYSGSQSNPPNLTGNYCNAFLGQVRLQGSGVLTNGTDVQYDAGSDSIETRTQITAADGTAPEVDQTVARDRTTVPAKNAPMSLDQFGSVKANDVGQGILGYRLDLYGGAGKSVCSGSSNANNNPIVIGACTSGSALCPSGSLQ